MAENIKEFFHNEGIHSTTIQPEFVTSDGSTVGSSSDPGTPSFGGGPIGMGVLGQAGEGDDCALECPKPAGAATGPASCQGGRCCPVPSEKKSASGSASNTPSADRRSVRAATFQQEREVGRLLAGV